MDRKGFTLAEILITLTLIGVVTSLTIPTLVNNVSDQYNKIAWKKAYADLSQATMLMAADNGGSLSGVFGTVTSDETPFQEAYAKYLNYIQKCNDNVPTGVNGCWHSGGQWYKLSGGVIATDYPQHSRLVLNNGSLLRFSYHSVTCSTSSVPTNNSCGEIYIDINGFNKPNKVGKDIFGVFVLGNGTVKPFGLQSDSYFNNPASNSCDAINNTDTFGWNCSASYLYQ